MREKRGKHPKKKIYMKSLRGSQSREKHGRDGKMGKGKSSVCVCMEGGVDLKSI